MSISSPENGFGRNLRRTALATVVFLLTGCFNTLKLKKIPAITDGLEQSSTASRERLPAVVKVDIPFERTNGSVTLPLVRLHAGQGLEINIAGKPVQREFGNDGACLELVCELDENRSRQTYLRSWFGDKTINPNGKYHINWTTIREALGNKVTQQAPFEIVLTIREGARDYYVGVVPFELENYLKYEQQWGSEERAE